MKQLVRLGVGLAVFFAAAGQALAAGNVVIGEFRVRGPNGGNDEFVELLNRSGAPVAIGGWKVSGSNNAGTTSTRVTIAAGVTLDPGCRYLLTNSSTSGGPYSGSVPGNQTYGTGITDDGGIALLTASNAVVDAVGLSGGSAYKEGTPLASLGSANLDRGYVRRAAGAQDTDDNSADFVLNAPSTPQKGCPGADAAPSVASTIPAAGATDVDPATNVTVTFSEPVDPLGTWFTIHCATSGDHTATFTGGPVTFTLDPDTDFAFGEQCTTTIVATAVHDEDTIDPPDTMVADFSWTVTTTAPTATIPQIQGSGQRSPFEGRPLSKVPGIVTALRTTGSARGFYLQDPSGDGDPATSDGIFVFTGSATPAVAVGDAVKVSGKVTEFASAGDLPETELTSPSTTVLSHANPLPAPVLIGQGGLQPPTSSIADGIVFDERLEGMLVELDDLQAVDSTNAFGELWVVTNAGAGATTMTPRGGIVISDGDFNPEKFRVDDDVFNTGGNPMPVVDVGASLPGLHVGVMDYAFSNYTVHLLQRPDVVASPIQQETTAIAGGGHELTVATFNVENLDPNDPQSKFDGLADVLLHHLRAPDVVALEEVQDNDGTTDDGVVDSSVTLAKLRDAVVAAGGPRYDYRWIDPVDDRDGGQPGGNIRVAFFFRTDVPGLSFVDRPGGDSTTPNAVVGAGDGTHLLYSPGRIDPASGAWENSRKPLAGEFLFDGHRMFMVANHFVSKLGDDPLWGADQPPVRGSEVQRHQQAREVAAFVTSLLGANPAANVIVLGDLNDFQFSDTVSILEGGGLQPLIDTLPPAERYTYVFDGNSQAIDHILTGGGLAPRPFEYDVVHVNSEFAAQVSDHDPQVAGFTLDPPTVSAGGPYAVDEGSSVGLAATGTDGSGGALRFRWDLDGDGAFETAGGTAVFPAAAVDGPATRSVRVEATAPDGATATDAATIVVRNVAPTAAFAATASVFAGDAVTLAVSSIADPSAADTAAGFTVAFDCGDGRGYGAFGAATTASCPTDDTGTRAVGARVRDKDGGTSEYTATVAVTVTVDSLCALTMRYETKAGVAESLCVKLRHGQFGAYANEVDAQSGKSLTEVQAATLKRLAMRL